MKKPCALIVVAGSILLVGCGTAPQQELPATAAVATPASSKSQPQPTAPQVASSGAAAPQVAASQAAGAQACPQCWIRITPLSSVATDFTRYPDEEYSNGYTRLVISAQHTRDNGAQARKGSGLEDVRSYKYVDRGPVARFFWGTHYAMNLTAAVSVGAFQATVPLMTIDHVSNRSEGEKYTRVVAHTAQNFPLFLLKGDGSNSIASIRFIVKSTDTVDANAAAQAIQVANVLVKTIVPASPVLTTLSAQQTKDAANALDKAIDQVLSRQLDEEQWIDNDIRRWNNGLSVSFRIPDASNEAAWGAEDGQLKPVGIWSISFEDPRPSIFSDIQVCPPWHRDGELQEPQQDATSKSAFHPKCPTSLAEAAKLAERAALSRPEQVLAFSLVNTAQSLGSVATYLKQTDFWSDAVATLSPANARTPQPDALARICRRIKNAIAGIGLNAVDSGIVVAAVRDGMGLPAATIDAMKKAPACALAVALD